VNTALPAQLVGVPEESTLEGSLRPYDYTRMLTIIEQAQKIKHMFNAQFDEDHKKLLDRRYLDLKFIQSVLSDLYRERMRLGKHMNEIKIRNNSTLPYKKLRTLRYYQKTIEEYAQNLEEILRQW
jgi:DNA polymerase elongation subunit (family B)